MKVYAMLKASVRSEHGHRVNWYFVADLAGEATYEDFQSAAQHICDQRGWSLINTRTVPKESCLDGMERQRQDSLDGDQIAKPAQPLP